MPKLNGLQSILLATAAQRDSRSFYPLPDSAAARRTKVPAALIKARFAEECEMSDAAAVSRTEGELRFGLYITAAGCAAIGVGEGAAPAGEVSATSDALATAAAPMRITKTDAVLELFNRDAGTTLSAL